MGNGERVETLGAQLRGAIAQAFDCAIAIDEGAGTSPEWLALCAHWRVPAVSEQEREEIRAAQKPERGAPVMELGAVIEAIVRFTRLEAKRIDTWEDPHEIRVAHDKLSRLVDRIADELVTSYRNLVLPPRRGMFGNVLVHHDPAAKKSAWEKAHAHAMRCRHCGAPRLRDADLTCAFCDQPMA